MATSLTEFACTVPAGTSFLSPVTVACNVGTKEVTAVRWRVPPGPRGHLGWWLAMGGVQVLPDQLGTYVVADGEWDTWVVDQLPNTGTWQFIGFNTGTNNHTVYLTFFTGPVASGIQLTGDILSGFPVSDADVPSMWLA